jgi:tRNA threonylcarbamoyladenosine biosynthesis protein TsaB
MAASGVRIEDVHLFAVAAGPGSFTGLRVGIATVQGLALALGRRVVAISVLDALARSLTADGAHIAPWVDAQRGQVFAALYAPDGRTILARPTARPPADTLAAWRPLAAPPEVHFIGDGAVRYADTLADAAGLSPPPRLAPVIGRLAAEDPDAAVLPHAVIPIYIRRPDAELARDRRHGS